nr:uncharacterized protein LOC110369600 isoform X1 [Helicoverpa armigera]XP_049698729.1 uncharacterized protein LOC110369600 isoform X2 [Helicoverpa armigera]XP_049698734.1 uncharacterized protein LOC110369600 isoform X3 [Helicoverpa armigera]XP_049698739.1 uncharacterized protein LOC110369600 isoform X4 [Helicoverpa armigera]
MMEGIITYRVTPLLKCIVLFLFIFTAKVLTSRPQEPQDLRNGIQHLKPSHYVRTFTKYHHRRTIQWNSQQNDLNNDWPVTNEQPKVIGKRNADLPNYVEVRDVSKVYQHAKLLKKRSIPDSLLKRVSNEPVKRKYWSVEHSKIGKRSLDVPNSNEFVGTSHELPRLDQFSSDTVRDNIVGSFEKKPIISSKENKGKNGLSAEIKNYKVKQRMIPTTTTTTMGPTISCLYKIHDSVAMSVTPSYADEVNAQLVVENDSFETGPISETTLPNGEVAQVEQCTDTRASCYTLWHQDKDGNITVLGQGCWRSSQSEGRSTCDRCTKVAAPRLPGTKFCCCSNTYCNADFLTLKEETVTMKAESTMDSGAHNIVAASNILASSVLAVVAILIMALLLAKLYCRSNSHHHSDTDTLNIEKGEVMGSGPDALATGLSCVDNLTLIEHIGQGKFGSVWRGSLGSTPVAVKLYSNSNTWQKEAAVYALPHLAHPNILRYYGSDSRASLTSCGRSQLIVVELCAEPLRARLTRAPLSWREFAHLAHGLAAALAHLHTPSGSKPCVVHRDVNSNNVLVTASGDARLADLGLAQLLHAARDKAVPTRITEAGTLRYLSPEALEGALDLSGARAALCAVDVFALALVLWEMLWRTRGAHAGPLPPYAPPYQHHGLPPRPSLAQMQSLVSRNKARPPLPKGPVQQSRALKIAADTCDECWDHDAEARLTAVCVEERMAELKQMLHAQGPLIHDNNLHPHPPADSNVPSPPESDKNSNCTTTQNCDVHTPLLYPHPHIGRNACIERNTHTNTQQTTVELIHKSLKDITAPIENVRAPNNEENCLSVARVPSHTRIPLLENSGLSEVRSYQRPLEYVQNDVTNHDIDRGPKQTNLLQDVKVEKPKWGIKKFFEKLNRNKMETEVKLAENSQRTMTSIVDKPSNINERERPSNLTIIQDRSPYNFEGPCTLSPPNKTLSPTMMMESENKVFNFKELPNRETEARTPNQIFAVIVPKAKPPDFIEMKNKKGSSESLNKRSVKTSLSSQSILKSNSESEDSTVKKRLSCDNRIINSASSSRASINLELQYMDTPDNYNGNISPFDINSDCSSSEDEHLMLLSENGGSKITMQTIPKTEVDKKKYQNEVLKESSQVTDFTFNKFQNKYTNFDNEFSDPNDKENLVNGYSGDNPVYLAALNGEIDTTELKYPACRSPKPTLKNLAIKRQHSLEQVSEIFTSAGDVNLLNPAGRVKTPGDLPVAVRRARRDRALQKGRASECNRLSLYDDRMMFGNSL